MALPELLRYTQVQPGRVAHSAVERPDPRAPPGSCYSYVSVCCCCCFVAVVVIVSLVIVFVVFGCGVAVVLFFVLDFVLLLLFFYSCRLRFH